MSHLERAREEIRRASDYADGEVQEQLLSVDEGIGELTDGDKTGSGELEEEADRFNEIEEKLRGLMDEADGKLEDALGNARNELDAYRREADLA